MVALAASDWFEITKEGFVTEKNIPALKESGLASTGKPSAAERIQQGIPSTSINLSDNRRIVNYYIITPSNGMFIKEVGQNRLRISYTTKIFDIPNR